LFGMGAGDDPKYFAARSDADCGKLTLLWTCLMSWRWLMMIGLTVLGLVTFSRLFPDRSTLGEVVDVVRLHHPASDWVALTADIAYEPELQPSVLVEELRRILGDDWATRLQFISEHGTINPERVVPAVLLYAIPPGFRSLMIVSLIAAAMAGFGAWINQSAGFFARDLYQQHFRPTAGVHELMIATWSFIGAIVAGGFIFAFEASSINDVWAWIIMGLGSGLMFPQMLPLYWQRFNGVGYTVGMLGGIAAALAQRFVGPRLSPDWAFLNEERWLLPIIGAAGLTASLLGSLASPPTPDAVLRRFFYRTLPFGFWAPFRRELPEQLRRRVAAEHRRDLAALPLALVFQTTAFLTPMLALTRNWPDFAACTAIMAASFAGLYFVWLRHVDESDAIVAESERLFSTNPEQHAAGNVNVGQEA